MNKQEVLQRQYGLGDMARWWLDQDTATDQCLAKEDIKPLCKGCCEWPSVRSWPIVVKKSTWLG
ncbi:hypothetical protein C4J89_4577 [Pseudomonas sp. R4-35-07]|uniref:hypothetical protein n=1 Tax=Pseudomonas sp. R4-35-07 TaxID=658643 RepID=UPI000F5665D8|nr:hypothetical protein [Pseudomonas sp. R4-35-07]AZF34014.1 hypothetical protein C4J89_4577 [Pseudomonas sp. R4-35-07]